MESLSVGSGGLRVVGLSSLVIVGGVVVSVGTVVRGSGGSEEELE